MKIDVSKCAFYNNGKCNNPNGMACNCCNNAYCYYKECQQLKIQNDKFKAFVADNLFNVNCDNWLDRFIIYFNEWKHELIVENEQLKDELECVKQNYSTDKEFWEIDKQKLEEIQELLNDTDSIVQDYETSYDLAKEILQIIEE